MKITNPPKLKWDTYKENLKKYIEANYSFVKELYLDLGVKSVRLLCYSEEFIPHIKKQMSYSVR